MLTTRCRLPKGGSPAEAGAILRPEIFAKEKPEECAPKHRPALLLCALFMAALISLSWEAEGAFGQEGRGSVPTTYQRDASHKGVQGHTRRSSTERKRHPRFRKARTRHRLRARRPYAKVAARHRASPARRHARHLRHGRYYARKSPGPRVSSVRAARTRSRNTRTLAAKGARPCASKPLVVGRPQTKQPLKGEAPVPKAPEQAPRSAEVALQAITIALGRDGRISVNVKDRPLGEMLTLMAEKHLFEIQGSLPRTALAVPVTMEFSDLTLNQAFEKMMRGYNYAFIREDVSDRRVLIVLGEIKRVEYREPVRPAQQPGQPPEQTPQQGAAAAPVAAAPQGAGEAPEGATNVPPRRRPVPQPPGGRPNVEGPSAPDAPVQGAETPQAPAPEQKGQEQQSPVRPGAESAAATPPKTEGGPAVQEERPPDQPALGSF